jgi:hydroxymethylbilane synthase
MVELRIGCRKSRLATIQTEQAGAYICSRSPGVSFRLVGFETSGDRIAGSLARAGGKGHFVREVEAALVSDAANLAIHCLKDMPGNEIESDELIIAGFLPREDPADVFISTRYASIADLPPGARVGTSSPRRAALLRAMRPDLEIDGEFRGSIDTRIQKVRDGQVDATLLAAAGLNRVGETAFNGHRLTPETFLPAIGQGTLALQCLAHDTEVRAICEAANDPDAQYAAVAERTCLRLLDGDCHSAIAGLCARADGRWRFSASVYQLDGTNSVAVALDVLDNEPAQAFGGRMAEALLNAGAALFLPTRGASDR